jgi:outer membrane protein OmpA-like peptidoglycan-associated protein
MTEAQFSVAIVAGPQVNSVTPDFSLNPDTSSIYSITKRTGLNFGFIGNIPLNKKQTFFFRTGILYSERGSQAFQSYDTAGADFRDGKKHFLETTTNLKVNYIDAPLNLLYKFPLKGKTKFLLGAGVQTSLFYNGSTDFLAVNVYKVFPDSPAKREYSQTTNKDLPVGTPVNKYRTIHFSANALTGFEFGRAFITVGYSNALTNFFESNDESFKHKTLTFNLGIFLGNSHPAKTDLAKVNVVKDRDRDGITDDLDQCPDVPGAVLTKGCPDKDGDGIADKDDRCPDVAGTLKYHGCPVPDSDKDGISDEQDKCPDVAGLEKYNGCPIPDTDKDGVNDEEDQCPTVAGDKDNHGCPKITKEEQQKIDYAAKRIQFEFNSVDISPSSFTLLDEVIEILKKNPTLKIRIEGHTSGRVSESNTILSEKRANSVKDYFVNKGISLDRIESIGMGSSKHISKDGDTKENPIDRRVEMILFQ